MKRISPTPLLMILAAQDQISPIDFQLEAFDLVREPKVVKALPGLTLFSQRSPPNGLTVLSSWFLPASRCLLPLATALKHFKRLLWEQPATGN